MKSKGKVIKKWWDFPARFDYRVLTVIVSSEPTHTDTYAHMLSASSFGPKHHSKNCEDSPAINHQLDVRSSNYIIFKEAVLDDPPEISDFMKNPNQPTDRQVVSVMG